jgi:hypothetical protein
MTAEFLKILASTVYLHLTTSLNMKSQHFKWVPHLLDDDLRAKRLEGARQLLDVLQAQERCHFRDLITGDETWVCLDMKPGTVWLPADAELLVRVNCKRKRMLTVFWGIDGTAHHCWFPKDSTLDSPFFCEEVLSQFAQKMRPNSRTTRKPLTLIHIDNARVYTARATQEKLDVSRFKRTPQPPHSPDIAPSELFLSGWLKTQLERRECKGEDELYEVVDEILKGLSIEMIETVFVDWMNRFQRLINGQSIIAVCSHHNLLTDLVFGGNQGNAVKRWLELTDTYQNAKILYLSHYTVKQLSKRKFGSVISRFLPDKTQGIIAVHVGGSRVETESQALRRNARFTRTINRTRNTALSF